MWKGIEMVSSISKMAVHNVVIPSFPLISTCFAVLALGPSDGSESFWGFLDIAGGPGAADGQIPTALPSPGRAELDSSGRGKLEMSPWRVPSVQQTLLSPTCRVQL